MKKAAHVVSEAAYSSVYFQIPKWKKVPYESTLHYFF